MKYFEKGGQKFIENGRTKVRVIEIMKMPSPIMADRTVRMCEVAEVFGFAPDNPICVGNHLALSFPNSHINAKEFDWAKETAENREVMCPVQISDKAVARIAANAGKN